ncbi:Oxygen-dependent choline dehydrogenase [Lachnellula arida]|uniref:Oxygen-dependent choline dehydrogenase n=1 Tax=Lachnellula arida TaxID=1316785 RepID=A0A8T9BNR1_9HELO|nr:Oxygen-dependent choline dehydrogenase [Lachnellula arida]
MKLLSIIVVLLHVTPPLVNGAPTATNASTNASLEYEYIVVGSGAGGGPLACRLAMAGHSTLLIESGNDQGGNVNISVPGYQAVVTQDPKLRWDVFANHYQNQTRAKRDPKYTYQVGPYQYYVGPDPPSNATELGILYPRAGTLGGASDWDGIAQITGDDSWAATNMNQYLDKVYEWLPTEPTDPTILLNDTMLTQHLVGGAAVMGVGPDPLNAITGLANTLLNDPNSQLNPARDSTQGFFQIPLIMKNGTRTAVRDFIVSTVAQGYPLTVRQNCHVTQINFNTSGSTPIATGVNFLDGEYLYSASPFSGGTSTPGTAIATQELIIAAGSFNTPQLLKLSGIGASEELNNFNISVISNLPGVGTNMQDRYEIPVNVKHGNDFQILEGCTFDGKAHDICLQKWQDNLDILAQRGAYATDGLAATMAVNSDFASTSDIDLFIFGGPVDFTGYFPQWGDAAVADHQHFSWYTLKAHTRNRAGTVELRSTNPLDTPIINFNYFDTGTTAGGADQLDLDAMIQAINMSRQALEEYSVYSLLGGDSFVEENPGPSVTSPDDIGQYIKDRAWGHHASCTCPIGADDDINAVLDSEFRVRGVENLRVVDASVFPSIPGIFIQAPIFMISEKAADVILN